VEQFKSATTEDNKNSYVVQKDGKTAGIIKIAEPVDDDLDDTYYEIHYIYLHPDCFRQGIGTLAVEFAFDKALELGKKFVSLWVLTENEGSIKFYEKCGFRADSETKIQKRGREVEIIRMVKDLRIS